MSRPAVLKWARQIWRRLPLVAAGEVHDPWLAGLMVALLVGMGLGIRLALDPLLGEMAPFVPFLPALLAASIWLGWRAGLGVMLLCGWLSNVLFLSSRYSVAPTGQFVAGLALFLLGGFTVLYAGEKTRRLIGKLRTLYERENILTHELHHRNKNMLAVVQSIAFHTKRSRHKNIDQLFDILDSRIVALAQAQDLLIRSKWERCALAPLAADVLAPFNNDGRIKIAGGECLVPASSCTPLVLILHELATNATKYGALSAMGGQVSLNWEQHSVTADIAIRWEETGGPPVTEPQQTGFGCKLIRMHAGVQAEGLEFRPEGVVCTIIVGAEK